MKPITEISLLSMGLGLGPKFLIQQIADLTRVSQHIALGWLPNPTHHQYPIPPPPHLCGLGPYVSIIDFSSYLHERLLCAAYSVLRCLHETDVELFTFKSTCKTLYVLVQQMHSLVGWITVAVSQCTAVLQDWEWKVHWFKLTLQSD